MTRSIFGAATFQNISPTGISGEYSFGNAIFNNQTDPNGEGTYALRVGFFAYLQASDALSLFPLQGIMHRYILTQIDLIDTSSFNGILRWNEDGEEIDVPTEFSVGVISSASVDNRGYPISELIYPELPTGAGFSVIGADNNSRGKTDFVGLAHWELGGLLPASQNFDVTAVFSTAQSNGDDAKVGVYTTHPHNKIYLRHKTDGKALTTPEAVQIYARLTEDTGSWQLTYYILVDDVELPYNFSTHQHVNTLFEYRWCETVQRANNKPTSIVDNGDSIDESSIGGSSALVRVQDVLSVEANGQTSFTLSNSPRSIINLTVNGLRYSYGVDFTILGQTLTWTDQSFTLEATDGVVADYMR